MSTPCPEISLCVTSLSHTRPGCDDRSLLAKSGSSQIKGSLGAWQAAGLSVGGGISVGFVQRHRLAVGAELS